MVFGDSRQGDCPRCRATQVELFEDSLASKARIEHDWRCRPCWDKLVELRQVLALHKEQMKDNIGVIE
jgi:hypothetical protein